MLNLILPLKYCTAVPFSHIRLYFINTTPLIRVIGNCMLGCIERPHLHYDIDYLIIFSKLLFILFLSLVMSKSYCRTTQTVSTACITFPNRECCFLQCTAQMCDKWTDNHFRHKCIVPVLQIEYKNVEITNIEKWIVGQWHKIIIRLL